MGRARAKGTPSVVASALPDEEVLQSNLLGTVTTNFLVLRDWDVQSNIIISLSSVTGMKKIKTTYPGLLVISAAVFVMAAAAFCSKEGHGADLPLALLGIAFVVAYFLSRRAGVSFILGSSAVQTEMGGPGEAAALIRAVQSAQRRLHSESDRSVFVITYEDRAE